MRHPLHRINEIYSRDLEKLGFCLHYVFHNSVTVICNRRLSIISLYAK